MVLFVEIEQKINAVKEYLKQIEEETMVLADRLKLDGQQRVGLEDKFKNMHEALDAIKPVEEPKPKAIAGQGIEIKVIKKP